MMKLNRLIDFTTGFLVLLFMSPILLLLVLIVRKNIASPIFF